MKDNVNASDLDESDHDRRTFKESQTILMALSLALCMAVLSVPIVVPAFSSLGIAEIYSEHYPKIGRKVATQLGWSLAAQMATLIAFYVFLSRTKSGSRSAGERYRQRALSFASLLMVGSLSVPLLFVAFAVSRSVDEIGTLWLALPFYGACIYLSCELGSFTADSPEEKRAAARTAIRESVREYKGVGPRSRIDIWKVILVNVFLAFVISFVPWVLAPSRWSLPWYLIGIALMVTSAIYVIISFLVAIMKSPDERPFERCVRRISLVLIYLLMIALPAQVSTMTDDAFAGASVFIIFLVTTVSSCGFLTKRGYMSLNWSIKSAVSRYQAKVQVSNMRQFSKVARETKNSSSVVVPTPTQEL